MEQNPQQPEQQVVPQQSAPQKPQSHLFTEIVFILLGVVVILGVAGASYYLGLHKSLPRNTEIQTSQSIVPTKTISSTVAQLSPTSSWTLSFQDSLSKYCKKVISNPSSFYYALDLSQLPLKIDSRFITPMPAGDYTPKCWGMPGTDSFNFQSTQGESFNIFDDKSVELGHGGYPLLKPVGTKFYDSNGITLYFIRGITIGSYIGTEGIDVRGFRKLTWPTGQSISIVTGKRAIDGADSRLVSVLNKYAISGTDDTTKDHMVVDPSKETQAEDDIKNTFFQDISTLQSPEKEVIDTLVNELNAFSIK